MVTDVDTEALRQLAAKIDAAAPQCAVSAASADSGVGHPSLISAIEAFETRSMDAVAKLHSDAQAMSKNLREAASVYEAADDASLRAIRDMVPEWGG